MPSTVPVGSTLFLLWLHMGGCFPDLGNAIHTAPTPSQVKDTILLSRILVTRVENKPLASNIPGLIFSAFYLMMTEVKFFRIL